TWTRTLGITHILTTYSPSSKSMVRLMDQGRLQLVEVFESLNLVVLAVQPAPGPFEVFGDCLCVQGSEAALQAIARLGPERERVILETEDVLLEGGRTDDKGPFEQACSQEAVDPSPIPVGIQVQEQSRSTRGRSYALQAQTKGFLLIRDNFHPGWKAFLDGKPAHIARADFVSMAIALQPGDHRLELRFDPFFAETRTLLTLHNLGYQGLFAPERVAPLGLDPDLLRLEAMEYYGNLSFLKGGIVFADLLSTVSPTYCREIQEPAYGRGLDGLLRLRQDDLFGILNGLDTELWDPLRDATLAAPYSHADLHGKALCKRALQQELGLEIDPARPLLAVVSRLDPQKGLDLVADAWDELMTRPVQLVILGTGQRELMESFAARAASRPGQVALKLGFDDALAHRIYAGSDIFLMPSRYEPCGLGQLIALRYGSVPLVRCTGGLTDTVSDCDAHSKSGNGFCFDDVSPQALLATVDRALTHWQERRCWLRLMRRGMKEDHSWERAANDYLTLYQRLRTRPHE
ncbi:MAG: hypothetical protein C0621_07600, partial [Desulfuromonas sp.]